MFNNTLCFASPLRVVAVIQITSTTISTIVIVLIKKITSGFIASVKAAKLLSQREAMSEDCAVLVDEMHLQKPVVLQW